MLNNHVTQEKLIGLDGDPIKIQTKQNVTRVQTF